MNGPENPSSTPVTTVTPTVAPAPAPISAPGTPALSQHFYEQPALPDGSAYTFSAIPSSGSGFKILERAWTKNKKVWSIGAAALVLLLIGGIVYIRLHKPADTAVLVPTTGQLNAATSQTPSSTGQTPTTSTSPNATATPSGGTSTTPKSTTPAPAAGSSSSSGGTTGSTPSACNNSAMPTGVCTAILSIEKDGIAGNPYVAFDTSNLPPGSTATLNNASWQSTGADSGTVAGVLSFQGQTYNGTVTFQNQSGTWRATNYAQS